MSRQPERPREKCAAGMKNLLLLAAIGVIGYYAYKEWSAKPVPAPLVAEKKTVAAPTPAPKPVDPSIKAYVDRMYGEWKERSLGTQRKQLGSRRSDMAELLTQIRRRLGGLGVHSDSAVRQEIIRALQELGVVPEECSFVANGLLSEAGKDGLKGSHNRSN